MDLVTLSVFPNDQEITELAKQAWDEADSLWTALGTSPADFMRSASSAPHLPSISSWFMLGQDPVLDDGSASSQSDDDGFQPEDEDKKGDNDLDTSRLQTLIDKEEHTLLE